MVKDVIKRIRLSDEQAALLARLAKSTNSTESSILREGIILGWIPPLFRDIWSHKTSKTLFLFVIFSRLGRSRKKAMFFSLLQAIDSGTILSGTASKS